jgi:hypothetical protein
MAQPYTFFFGVYKMNAQVENSTPVNAQFILSRAREIGQTMALSSSKLSVLFADLKQTENKAFISHAVSELLKSSGIHDGKVWTACRQYTKDLTIDGERLNYRAKSVTWKKAQIRQNQDTVKNHSPQENQDTVKNHSPQENQDTVKITVLALPKPLAEQLSDLIKQLDSKTIVDTLDSVSPEQALEIMALLAIKYKKPAKKAKKVELSLAA